MDNCNNNLQNYNNIISMIKNLDERIKILEKRQSKINFLGVDYILVKIIFYYKIETIIC